MMILLWPLVCSVSYASFEDALVKIRSFGIGALMAKADIKSAFCLLPLSPSAFNSLGFQLRAAISWTSVSQ